MSSKKSSKEEKEAPGLFSLYMKHLDKEMYPVVLALKYIYLRELKLKTR